jgi:hypothetical protein
MASWCSFFLPETAFILVVTGKKTLLPPKNVLAPNDQENKPVAGDSDATADQVETKWIDMVWMGCEPSNCNLSYHLTVIRTLKNNQNYPKLGYG